MPFYEYVCPDGHHSDHRVRVDDRDALQPCATCTQPAKRVYSADIGFRIGKEGLLNTRTLPNDGVHGLAKAGRVKTYAARSHH